MKKYIAPSSRSEMDFDPAHFIDSMARYLSPHSSDLYIEKPMPVATRHGLDNTAPIRGTMVSPNTKV